MDINKPDTVVQPGDDVWVIRDLMKRLRHPGVDMLYDWLYIGDVQYITFCVPGTFTSCYT